MKGNKKGDPASTASSGKPERAVAKPARDAGATAKATAAAAPRQSAVQNKRARQEAVTSTAARADIEDEDADESSGTDSDALDMTATWADSRTREQDEEDDEDEDGEDDKVVNVEFLFCDPREIDYKSVRRLVERFLPGREDTFNASGMADAIIGQVAVGTMVKIGDDLDVYAFATLLPLALYRHTDWMKSIRAYVCEKVERHASGSLASFQRFFDEGRGALMLNERLVNMPPELAPGLHDCLMQDIAWAVQNAPEAQRDAFRVDSVLLLCPCWREARTTGQPTTHARGAAASTSATHFFHFEEELYESQATAVVEFPVASPGGAAPATRAAAPAATGKRRRGAAAPAADVNAEAAEPGVDEEDAADEEAMAAAVTAHTRKIMLVPARQVDGEDMDVLLRCVDGMQSMLEAAQKAEAAEQAARSGTHTRTVTHGTAKAAQSAASAPAREKPKAAAQDATAKPARKGAAAK